MSRLPIFLLLSGCSAALAGLEIDPALAPVPMDDAPQLFAELPGHGEAVRQAASAAVTGDRVGVDRALGPLRDQFTHGAIPADQRAYVYGVIDRVPMALHARTDDEVQRGVGLVLAWCGDCHEASGAESPSSPPAVLARSTHAALADIAVDAALWPDGPAWGELTTKPRGAVYDEAVTAVLAALGDLPRDPKARASTAVRAETFRRVSAACVECHTRDGLATGE